MLVLSRKVCQKILIGNDIVIKIVDLRDGLVRVGIEAPRDVKIIRDEVAARDKRTGSVG